MTQTRLLNARPFRLQSISDDSSNPRIPTVTTLLFLFGLLAICRVCSASFDGVLGRIGLHCLRLTFLAVLTLGVVWFVSGTSSLQEGRQSLQQSLATVNSTVAQQVFFSSSPHPGVVKQTMGSSRALEEKQ